MLHLGQLIPPSTDFAESIDRQPFLFKHNLDKSDLFSRAALKSLVERVGALPSRNAKTGRPVTRGFFIMKDVGNLEWGTPEFQTALNRAYEDIDLSGARIKLTAIHQFDEYAAVLAECVDNLSEAAGINFGRRFSRAIATLFITSPGEFTPYHIDQETNFLLQIAGQKEVSLFDGSDRTVVTDRQLESFWVGHHFIEEKEGSQPRKFLLEPGYGVHHPSFFPHNVRVGSQMSVSLSLGFQRAQFTDAEVYLLNAYLRKMGLHPTPPGKNHGVDTVKGAIAGSALRAKRAILGTPGIPLSLLQSKYHSAENRSSTHSTTTR